MLIDSEQNMLIFSMLYDIQHTHSRFQQNGRQPTTCRKRTLRGSNSEAVQQQENQVSLAAHKITLTTVLCHETFLLIIYVCICSLTIEAKISRLKCFLRSVHKSVKTSHPHRSVRKNILLHSAQHNGLQRQWLVSQSCPPPRPCTDWKTCYRIWSQDPHI